MQSNYLILCNYDHAPRQNIFIPLIHIEITSISQKNAQIKSIKQSGGEG